MALLDFLKRDKVKDPFGGDDMYDGESRFAGKGPKIALAGSVVMFLILAGGITAVVLTGKSAPPPVAGSLSDIEVVEDATPPAAPATTNANPNGAANAPAAAKPAPDAIAATDRSTDRRPWLNTPVPTGERLGVKDAGKPAAPAAPAPKPTAVADAKPALMTPSPPAKPAAAPAPVPAPTPAAPPATVPAPAPAAAAPASQQAAAAPKSPVPTPAPAAPAKGEPAPAVPEKDVAEVLPFGAAPGAPSHFTPTGADTGPAIAGGKPRLAEPTAPPTDRTAVASPPPRFANLAQIKNDPAKASPAAARVAVVIDGLGLSQSATETAIAKMPAAVTLAFSPYARDLKKWMEKAKASGHEVLIEVPMESKAFPAQDPGPLGLLTTADAKDNAEKLETILKAAGPAIGVFDAAGSKFRESDANISPVFATLKEKNLFYVQGEPGVRVGESTIPVAVTDVVLDERPFRAAVDARLDYMERLAKYQGSAVVTLSAKPVGFERLVLWLEQAQKKGVSLTPISQVMTSAENSEPAVPAARPKTPAAGQPVPGAKAARAPAKAKS